MSDEDSSDEDYWNDNFTHLLDVALDADVDNPDDLEYVAQRLEGERQADMALMDAAERLGIGKRGYNPKELERLTQYLEHEKQNPRQEPPDEENWGHYWDHLMDVALDIDVDNPDDFEPIAQRIEGERQADMALMDAAERLRIDERGYQKDEFERLAQYLEHQRQNRRTIAAQDMDAALEMLGNQDIDKQNPINLLTIAEILAAEHTTVRRGGKPKSEQTEDKKEKYERNNRYRRLQYARDMDVLRRNRRGEHVRISALERALHRKRLRAKNKRHVEERSVCAEIYDNRRMNEFLGKHYTPPFHRQWAMSSVLRKKKREVENKLKLAYRVLRGPVQNTTAYKSAQNIVDYHERKKENWWDQALRNLQDPDDPDEEIEPEEVGPPLYLPEINNYGYIPNYLQLAGQPRFYQTGEPENAPQVFENQFNPGFDPFGTPQTPPSISSSTLSVAPKTDKPKKLTTTIELVQPSPQSQTQDSEYEENISPEDMEYDQNMSPEDFEYED